MLLSADDLKNFFRLKNHGSTATQVTPLGELVWDVCVLHDHDGYGIGVSVHGNRGVSQIHLEPDEATAFGMGLLQAAAMGTAWDRVRRRAN